MRLRGWIVDGVELSPDAVRVAKERHGLNLFCGGVETYAPVDPYDAICLYQCLEHLADPVAVLRRCRGWLREGGIIVIEVPHAQSFDMIWNAERTRYSYDLPRHLHHFTPGSLARLLRQEGFEIAAVDRFLPRFALRLEEAVRATRRRTTGAGQSATAGIGPNASRTLPMMRRPAHWKATVEGVVSRLFPGWRFTIVGRKA
jgi:SAM-dependent methyltransferase